MADSISNMIKSIVYRHDRAARITEHHIDLFLDQYLHKSLRPSHLHLHTLKFVIKKKPHPL
jgi:hypothetical protein